MFFGLLLLLLAAVPLSAANDIDSAFHYLIEQQYSDATRCTERHLAIAPSDFKAHYLLLMIEQTRILDYESSFENGSNFVNNAKKMIVTLESRLPLLRGRDSLECLYLMANSYGGISIIQAKMGSLLESAKNAFVSIGHLKTVINIDKDFHAAYLGIGIFNYYLNSSLKWVPFVANERKGVQYMEKALKASMPYNYAAKNSLCWVLIDKKEYQKADSLAKTVLAEYPANTMFLRIRAINAVRSGEFGRALVIGKRIDSLSRKRALLNWPELITAHYVKVISLEKLGNVAECLDASNAALAELIPENVLQIPYVKRHLAYIHSVKNSYSK